MELTIGLEPLLEMPRPGISLVENLEAVESHSNRYTSCKRLLLLKLLRRYVDDGSSWCLAPVTLLDSISRLHYQVARTIVDAESRCANYGNLVSARCIASSEECLETHHSQHISLLKGLLELFHAHTLCIHNVLGRTPGEQSAKAVVKVYEILGHTAALALVCAEYAPLSHLLVP